MYYITGVVLALISLVVIEILFDAIFSRHQKKHLYKSIAQLSMTFVFLIMAIVLESFSEGRLGASIIWADSIPENGNFPSPAEAPLYTFDVYLEKRDTPVYLKVEPIGKSIENVDFSLSAPDGSIKIIIPPDYDLYCGNKMGCDPVVLKFWVQETGNHVIKIKSLRPFGNPITIKIFESDWNYLNIDN
jgi:hypothetical protein